MKLFTANVMVLRDRVLEPSDRGVFEKEVGRISRLPFDNTVRDFRGNVIGEIKEIGSVKMLEQRLKKLR